MGITPMAAPSELDETSDPTYDQEEVLLVARRMQREGLLRIVFDGSKPIGWEGRWRFIPTEFGEKWFALREQGLGYEEAKIVARPPFVPRSRSSYRPE
jgi:hypothetical protein